MRNTFIIFLLAGNFMLSYSAIAQQQASPDSIDAMLREIPEEVFELLQNRRESGHQKTKMITEESARVYTIPAASSHNVIELTIANASGIDVTNLQVKAEGLPGWLRMESSHQNISKLPAGDIATVSFRFDMAAEVPVQQKTDITLTVSGDGYSSGKTIQIVSGKPLQFKLNQNYPNPFNPSTTISYRLPSQMQVTVTVYNLLGRKVATLADGLQEAGTQTLRWDASRYASGVYFYQVIATGTDGDRFVQHRKMMLIK